MSTLIAIRKNSMTFTGYLACDVFIYKKQQHFILLFPFSDNEDNNDLLSEEEYHELLLSIK